MDIGPCFETKLKGAEGEANQGALEEGANYLHVAFSLDG